MEEFNINDYLMLRLEGHKTVIYVSGEEFMLCKLLLLNITSTKTSLYDQIESIDDATEHLEENKVSQYKANLNIPYEEEFWAHCSNLEVWAKYDYDTRLLHKSLAFPLLKALVEAGDIKAKHAFKEEIAIRIESGSLNVVLYLLEEGYLKYLNREELSLLLYESNTNLRKNIEAGLAGDISLRKLALLTLKELAELNDESAKRKSIKEFHNELKKLDLSEYSLIVKREYYKYLDRKTMVSILLKENDAKALLKMDALIYDRWLEFKEEKGWGEIYRKEYFNLKPTYTWGEPGEEREPCSFLAENRQIIDLELSDVGYLVFKEFPEPLLELTALKKLDLSFNKISKIPESISSLKKLKILNLRSNNILTLPKSIYHLESLEELNLHSNRIENMPESITNLKFLKTLKLTNNKLRILPEAIGDLKSLENLSLYGNDITFLPESIGKLPSLKHLDIAHTKLKSLPDAILNLESLKFIQTDHTQKDLYPLQDLKKKGVKIYIY